MQMLKNKSNKTILGFNVGHNGSCTLIHNDKMVSISEERLNRNKNSDGYMYAVNYCLNAMNIKLEDIDLFISSNYGKPLPENYMGDFKNYNISKDKFISIDHHLSHACCSYFLSEFDKALIIVIDGSGNNNDTESYYIGESNTITKIGGNDDNRNRHKGIGRTYETFSNFCGYSAQQAGKTMGLSAYGKLKYPNIDLYEINDNMQISSKCEGKYIEGSLNFIKENKLDFGKPLSGFENRDAAFYVQYETEKIILELVRRLYDKYKIKKLCLAGGVFLNGVINQRILEETQIEEIYVPPCCDDTGQSLGNALYGYHYYFKNNKRNPLTTPYLARAYTEDEILDALDKKQVIYTLPYEVKSSNFSYVKSNNITKDTAKLLKEGNIIGWLQDASEIGPRALGNRSILCLPYPYEMKDILNNRIKHRENFRPFAPAILEEDLYDYFEINDISPYMLKVPKCKPGIEEKIPATLNIDRTGRVQSVNEKQNKRFYELLKEVKKLTGIPILLNTSFNDNGKPIVETPKDALVMFCTSELDYLVIGDYIISKEAKNE